MNVTAAIALMAAGVFALRLGGFLLVGTAIPPAWERSLAYVPVATLAALVAGSLVGQAREGFEPLIAAAAGALIVRHTGRAWTCILGGMAVYALLRLL